MENEVNFEFALSTVVWYISLLALNIFRSCQKKKKIGCVRCGTVQRILCVSPEGRSGLRVVLDLLLISWLGNKMPVYLILKCVSSGMIYTR